MAIVKMLTLIASLAILTAPIAQAEAFWDVFSKTREQKIDDIIIKSLESSDVKWVKIESPSIIKTEYNKRTLYTPEQDTWNEKRTLFGFEEFNLAKHPKCRTLSDLVKADIIVFNRESNPVVEKDLDNKLVQKKFITNINIIPLDGKSYCSEVQNVLSISGPEKINNALIDYAWFWTVDIGGGKFRKYNFQFSEKIPSVEERMDIIDFFKYLESQIQNVPS